jgi:hypothetical protein
MSGEFRAPVRSHHTEKVPDGVLRYTFTELRPAANAAVAITDVVDRLVLESTSAATPAITTTSAREGQRVTIVLITESSTGTYTMAGVFGASGTGTLTFDAINELATIEYVGGIWRVTSLIGATVV